MFIAPLHTTSSSYFRSEIRNVTLLKELESYWYRRCHKHSESFGAAKPIGLGKARND